ncbi:MAG: hypothetical protein BM557_08585 [Flavobacterium sp. MedPE-SWcel]|uniref:hypothetical protein n=1 Tax=uncultured Flavobacterium sp. TaxID=165435 RepID=UPI00091D03C1|nr:hypothetical protein [uncultured Flavobacterium sp.]OIQ17260.1 MAG: hypothetical protein BM557_08585 [Flavobacterium sp. MedPE-SWcel]
MILSCSNNSEDKINKVEDVLGTGLPSDCKLDYNSEAGIGESLLIINITLDKNEFDELLKNIDTTSFEKSGDSFYKNIIKDEDNTINIVLFKNKSMIKYSEREI